MYVVSGRLKGKKIDVPRSARPTSSRVRRVIMETVREFIDGAGVLDLFAGSGALGIEALSCGASFCDFVDIDNDAQRRIRQNISQLGLSECSRLHGMDAYAFMRESVRQRRIFDVICVDPPYHTDHASKFLKTLEEYDIVSPSGVIILQSFIKDTRVYNDKKINVLSQKKVGQDLVLFCEVVRL